MATPAALRDLLVHLVDPWLFMALALRHVPRTLAAAVASGELATLLSPAALSAANFGRFWAAVGPDVRQAGEERVVPLLEGRVARGRVHPGVVGVPVHGTVVEVGAGTGLWADVFARIRAASPSPSAARIAKIYGVEPNPRSAAALARRVVQLGLGDVYQVVPVGIEALGDPAAWGGHIAPGSVDCVVSVLCLCSIPDPEANVHRLHRLLKPGGRWYVYEHVKATRGGAAAAPVPA